MQNFVCTPVSIWKLAFCIPNFQNLFFKFSNLSYALARFMLILNCHPRSSSTSTRGFLAEFLGYFNFTYNLSLYFSPLNTSTLSLDIILFPPSQITHPSLFFAYAQHTLFSLHLSSSLPCYFHRVFKFFLNFLR